MPRRSASAATPGPVARVVLLGASNLTRGISTAVGTALGLLPGPLDIVVFMGHGRSFGRRSRVLARSLPGIVESDGWAAIDDRAPLPTRALVTDIGNDIVYGHPVPAIVEWIDRCLARLAAHDARTVVTGLPLESLARLGPIRFRAARSILFPGRPLRLDDVRARAGDLDAQVEALAARHGAVRVPLPGRWYGLDPIHIRSPSWPEAWSSILGPWRPDVALGSPIAAPSPRRWLQLRTAVPRSATVLGLPIGARQPCRRLPDGSTVSFY